MHVGDSALFRFLCIFTTLEVSHIPMAFLVHAIPYVQPKVLAATLAQIYQEEVACEVWYHTRCLHHFRYKCPQATYFGADAIVFFVQLVCCAFSTLSE